MQQQQNQQYENYSQDKLQDLLKNQLKNQTLSLIQLLPEIDIQKKIIIIKKTYNNQFVNFCQKNKKIVKDMIYYGIIHYQQSTEYIKKIALFSVEVLIGQLGQSDKLFIVGQLQDTKNQILIKQQITKQKIGKFKHKYDNLAYLLQYLQKPKQDISPICINYIMKILSNLMNNNRALDLYTFFYLQSIDQQSHNKHKIDCFIELIPHFPGISEILCELIAEEGETNQYISIKKDVISKICMLLQSQQLIKQSNDNFKQILDFVSYVFSRNKYKSQDTTISLAKITQIFVNEEMILYFKQRMIKSAYDSNKIVNNKKKDDGLLEDNKQFQKLQNIFQNSLAFLKILIQRLNYDQQKEQSLQQSTKPSSQPTMDFQVDRVLYQKISLQQLLGLAIPYEYKNATKASYYEMLVQLSQNRRFVKQINQESLQMMLINLLKMFRKQRKGNGLIKFYLQELVSEIILPKINKFNDIQAMKILSAFNPSQNCLNKYDDYRVFAQKIMMIIQKKCEWYTLHFNKLGINLAKIKQNYKVKLSGNLTIFQSIKIHPKQFKFLYDNNNVQQLKQFILLGRKTRRARQSQYRNDDSSSSSSSSQKEQLPLFEPKQKNQNNEVDNYKGNNKNIFEYQLDNGMVKFNFQEIMQSKFDQNGNYLSPKQNDKQNEKINLNIDDVWL